MSRIPVNPDLLTWTRERACQPDRQAGLDALALVGNFPKLISGELRVKDAEIFLETNL